MGYHGRLVPMFFCKQAAVLSGYGITKVLLVSRKFLTLAFRVTFGERERDGTIACVKATSLLLGLSESKCGKLIRLSLVLCCLVGSVQRRSTVYVMFVRNIL